MATINGTFRNDLLLGIEEEWNNLFGGAGDDTLTGGRLRDILQGDDGNDSIIGNGGDDVLSGGSGNNTMDGGDGNDWIAAGSGDDQMVGGLGNDTINGNQGNDIIYDSGGTNFLLGGQGNDTIYGSDQQNTIFGDRGNDAIYGGSGVNIVNGNRGDDTIYGGDANDFLRGGKDNDIIYGRDGDDTISGDLGSNTMFGGGGDDNFWIRVTNKSGIDQIMDFETGHDKIVIISTEPRSLQDLLMRTEAGRAIVSLLTNGVAQDIFTVENPGSFSLSPEYFNFVQQQNLIENDGEIPTIIINPSGGGGGGGGGAPTPPANSAPELSNIGGATAYTQNAAAVVVDGALDVADNNNANIASAEVWISAGGDFAADVLNFVDTASITHSYNAATGVLTLTGSDTKANYEAALESITFNSTSAIAGNRTISFKINDGAADSNTQTATITYSLAPVNAAPVNSVPAAQSTIINTSFVVPGLSVSDADDATLATYTYTLSVDHGTISLNTGVVGGITAGQVSNNGTGTVVITGATLAQINATLADAVGVTYDPTAAYTGGDTITITSDDGNGGTDIDTVGITVNPLTAPVNTVPGAQTVTEDVAKVISGISIADTNDLTLATYTLTVSHGVLTLNNAVVGGVTAGQITGNGTATVTITGATLIEINNTLLDPAGLTYTPTANYQGPDTLQITADDGVESDSDNIAITVNSVNDAAVITDVAKPGTEDTTVTFALANFTGQFTDVDGDGLVSIKIISLPANGTLLLSGNPVLANDVIVAANIANLTFVPTGNWNGTTSFDWQASDGTVFSATQQVDITIAAVNDAPVITDVPRAGTEDITTTFTLADFTNQFTDVDGDSLVSIKIISLPANGTLKLGVVNVNVNDVITAANIPNLNFVPTANWNGSTSFDWQANDGTGLSATEQVNITIAAVNDAPTVATPLVDQSTAEDAAFSYQFGSSDFSDVDVSDTLTYSATLVSGAPLPAWLTFNAGTRTFSGTPANGDVGNINIRVTATDNGTVTLSTSDIFTITVNNTNDAPTVANALVDQSATEDAVFTYQFAANSFNDVDVSDTLTYSALLSSGAALPAWLTFNAATRTFSGTPLNANVGTITVRVTADDGNGGTITDDFTITTTNTNDAPTVANALIDQSGNSGNAFSYQFAANSFNDVDVSDTLTYSALLSSGAALPAWLTFNAATRTFSGTPAGGDVGTISVRVTATDGSLATTTDDFDIVIGAPAAQAPVNTVPATYTMNEDVATVLNGISIADADTPIPASVTLTINHGTITLLTNVPLGLTAGMIAGNGTTSITITGATLTQINNTLADANGLTYTPTANYNGTATLTVVTDDSALSDTDSSTITINPVNDAPVLGGVSGGNTYTEYGAHQTVDGSVTITDVDTGDVAGDSIAGATVVISANYLAGDILEFTPVGNITGNYVAGTRTLTLTGTDTQANYKTALESVKFYSSSTTPGTATRSIEFTLTDVGGLPSTTQTATVNVQDVVIVTANTLYDLEATANAAWAGVAGATVVAAFTSPYPTTYALSATTSAGVAYNSFTIDTNTGAIAHTGNLPNANESYVITVTATDSQLTSASQTFELWDHVGALNYTGTTGNDSPVVGTGTRWGDRGNDNLLGGNPATLHGGSGDDTLTSSNSNTKLQYGGGGNDSLTGLTQNDTLYGGIGNDTLSTGTSNDSAYGGAGNDSIDGGSSNDTAYGGTGDDTIDGGTGNDAVYGDAGDDTIYGNIGADSLTGGTGADRFKYTSQTDSDTANGKDTITDFSQGEGDKIWFLNGFDKVTHGTDAATATASDTLLAGVSEGGLIWYYNGANTIIYDPFSTNTTFLIQLSGNINLTSSSDFLFEGSTAATTGDTLANKNDTLNGSSGNYVVGLTGDDSLTTGSTSVTINGGDGNDTLSTGYRMYGGEGNDSILGSTNNETLFGGSGVDTLYGNQGTDLLYGGTGADYFTYSGITDSQVAGRDTIVDFSQSDGDKLWIKNGFDKIFAGNGTFANDTAIAGIEIGNLVWYQDVANNLTYVYDPFNTTNSTFSIQITNLFTLTSADFVFSSNTATTGTDGVNDVISGSSGIIGMAGNDSLTGTAASTTLNGGDGNDSINSGSGSPMLMYGGAGNDSISGGGSASADTIFGGTGNDILYGNTGSETLYGGTGADSFAYLSFTDSTATSRDIIADFSQGSDLLWMRNGFDKIMSTMGDFTSNDTAIAGIEVGNLVYYQLGGNTFVYDPFNTANSPNMVNSAFSIQITGLFTLTSADFVFDSNDPLLLEDTVAGNHDTFNNAGGIVGLLGDDTISASAAATINGGVGNDSLTSGGGNVILFGGAGNDSLSGGTSSIADTLYGGSGNDTLWGGTTGTGADLLYGNAGADLFVSKLPTDSTVATMDIIRDFSQGSDQLWMRNGYDTIVAAGAATEVGQLEWTTSPGNTFVYDPFTTNSTFKVQITGLFTLTSADFLFESNTTSITGTAGADNFTGGGGIVGLAGDDTITISASGSAANGGAGNDVITVSSGTADRIYGGAGNDSIIASSGVDSLFGGSGADTIQGGTGADVIGVGSLDAAVDRIQYSATTDGAAAGAVTGYDSISEFEVGTDKIAFTSTINTNFDDITNNDIITWRTNQSADFRAAGNAEALMITSAAGLSNADLTTAGLANILTKLNTIYVVTASNGDDGLIAVEGTSQTAFYMYTENGTAVNNVVIGELTLLGISNGLLTTADFMLF